jgi:hypothetical protein
MNNWSYISDYALAEIVDIGVPIPVNLVMNQDPTEIPYILSGKITQYRDCDVSTCVIKPRCSKRLFSFSNKTDKLAVCNRTRMLYGDLGILVEDSIDHVMNRSYNNEHSLDTTEDNGYFCSNRIFTQKLPRLYHTFTLLKIINSEYDIKKNRLVSGLVVSMIDCGLNCYNTCPKKQLILKTNRVEVTVCPISFEDVSCLSWKDTPFKYKNISKVNFRLIKEIVC